MVATAQELYKSEFGAHFLIVYHDLATFREMYSHYVKAALKDNQIVVILPFYETVYNVRHILSEDSACINVRKSEKNNHF
jgi:choline kinase